MGIGTRFAIQSQMHRFCVLRLTRQSARFLSTALTRPTSRKPLGEHLIHLLGIRRVIPRDLALMSVVLILARIDSCVSLLGLLHRPDPTNDTWQILAFNSLACIVAARNSFFWNKIWTFQYHEPVTSQLVLRFAGVSLVSMLGNNIILWIFIQLLPSTLTGAGVGATLLKIAVAATMMFLSFAGQLTLVFVKNKQETKKLAAVQMQARPSYFPISLSVVLPAYNEEKVIANTVARVFQALSRMVADFEILVVNDGSKDRTGAIVAAMAAQQPRVRLITHQVNQGAGAALVSGFMRATKAYTFYMDSDGQFDIYDLAHLLPYVGKYDGVFGYRLDRQDSRMRKLNAWGWNQIVRFVFNVRIKDIDCAFKKYNCNWILGFPIFHKWNGLLSI